MVTFETWFRLLRPDLFNLNGTAREDRKQEPLAKVLVSLEYEDFHQRRIWFLKENVAKISTL
jgi:hypothetical protein